MDTSVVHLSFTGGIMSAYRRAMAILEHQKRTCIPRRTLDKIIINLLLVSALINMIVLYNVVH